MKLKAAACLLSLLPVGMAAQRLDPSAILHPVPGSWPTYNGDYSGRRFSPLAQIHQGNVRDLRLAFAHLCGRSGMYHLELANHRLREE